MCVFETLPVNEGNRDAKYSITSYEYSTLRKSGASLTRSPPQSGSRDMLDISLLQTCRLTIHGLYVDLLPVHGLTPIKLYVATYSRTLHSSHLDCSHFPQSSLQ